MATRGQITVTVGPSGSGKSFRRCAHYLVNDFFMTCDGPLWTNFPLGVVPADHTVPPRYDGETFAERIAEEVEKRHGIPAGVVHSRINLIPADELARWADQTSSPLEYFADKDIDGGRIMIDEVHEFASRHHKPAHLAKWSKFNGTLRHEGGCSAEYLSQHPVKVAKEINREADVQLYMNSVASERDPFFKIELGDWYELRAKFTGRYNAAVTETEKVDREGRWVVNDRRVYALDSFYFRFYDSYSASDGSTKSGAPRRMFQRLSWPGLLAWFVGKNAGRLFTRGVFVGFVVWLCVLGGAKATTDAVTNSISRAFGGKNNASSGAAAVADGGNARAVKSAAVAGAGGDVAEVAVRGAAGGVHESTIAASDLLRQLKKEEVAQIELLNQIAASRAEAEAVRSQLAAAIVRAEAAESELTASAALAMITKDGVVMRNGYLYTVGEIIDFGPHRGRRVESVDWLRRLARLDDGAILRLGADSRPSAPFSAPTWMSGATDAAGSVGAGLSRSLPGGGGNAGQSRPDSN